jgi:metal-responsive CopG/Arc/MetJ family transcriptional regulator
MRTTIELSDEHRAKLMALAAERGVRGFSELVRDAIEHYLSENWPDSTAWPPPLASSER